MMVRIEWTEPHDSRIRPGHQSVLMAPWSIVEARKFARKLTEDGKICVHIKEISG